MENQCFSSGDVQNQYSTNGQNQFERLIRGVERQFRRDKDHGCPNLNNAELQAGRLALPVYDNKL